MNRISGDSRLVTERAGADFDFGRASEGMEPKGKLFAF